MNTLCKIRQQLKINLNLFRFELFFDFNTIYTISQENLKKKNSFYNPIIRGEIIWTLGVFVKNINKC